jgi:hypothetical protein
MFMENYMMGQVRHWLEEDSPFPRGTESGVCPPLGITRSRAFSVDLDVPRV